MTPPREMQRGSKSVESSEPVEFQEGHNTNPLKQKVTFAQVFPKLNNAIRGTGLELDGVKYIAQREKERVADALVHPDTVIAVYKLWANDGDRTPMNAQVPVMTNALLKIFREHNRSEHDWMIEHSGFVTPPKGQTEPEWVITIRKKFPQVEKGSE
ncbi:MAG: hypothetical protein WC607_04095 [Candidatus Micrarchaeia archaeon]